MLVCSHYLSVKDVNHVNLKRKIRTEYAKYFSTKFWCFPQFLSGVTCLLLLRGFVWFISLLKRDETKMYMDFSICKWALQRRRYGTK